MQTIQKKNYL